MAGFVTLTNSESSRKRFQAISSFVGEEPNETDVNNQVNRRSKLTPTEATIERCTRIGATHARECLGGSLKHPKERDRYNTDTHQRAYYDSGTEIGSGMIMLFEDPDLIVERTNIPDDAHFEELIGLQLEA